MAKRKRKKRNVNKGTVLTAICAIAVFVILAVSQGADAKLPAQLQGVFDFAFTQNSQQAPKKLAALDENADTLVLYAIDTGNSDSLLLYTPDGYSMLIDAADDDDFATIDAVCSAFDIESLTAAVATHPDADHIGSMDDVIANYTPETFYMPDVEKDTKTYVNMQAQLTENNIPVVNPVAGQSFMLGSEVVITVLSPQPKEYEDYNDASIVLLVQFGQTSFLLTGDIEQAAIDDLLLYYYDDLDVDVLKVAHHGSKTSTSQEFLTATTPEIAIINAGKDNDYGHPHSETTRLLDENGVITLRTDINEDIVVYSDGQNISYATAA